jgi:hypothetical protein
MRRVPGIAIVAVLLGPAVAGCGSRPAGTGAGAGPPPSAAPSAYATVMTPGQERAIPDPGTGTGDARLARALLASFRSAREFADLPGAVIAFPVASRRSMFIGLRWISSPLSAGRGCDKWTAGLWVTAVRQFNTRGVQLAVTQLGAYGPAGGSPATMPAGQLGFSEAILTGPARMLDLLGDPRVPASCQRLTGPADDTGAIQSLPVPRLGERSWAFRITGSRPGWPVWLWAEVIQTRRYVLEVSIPVQAPARHSDPVRLLPQIARAAYTRAQAVLR